LLPSRLRGSYGWLAGPAPLAGGLTLADGARIACGDFGSRRLTSHHTACTQAHPHLLYPLEISFVAFGDCLTLIQVSGGPQPFRERRGRGEQRGSPDEQTGEAARRTERLGPLARLLAAVRCGHPAAETADGLGGSRRAGTSTSTGGNIYQVIVNKELVFR
jgi:hypothetical protein